MHMRSFRVALTVLTFCGWTLALRNISTPAISSSPPGNAVDLDRSLFSFSIEFAYLDAFGGNDSAPNELTRQLMSQLEQRTGVGPDVRPGGITIDSSIFDPKGPPLKLTMSSSGGIYRTTYGPGLYESLNVFPDSTKFVVTVNLGNATIAIARNEAAAALQYIGLDHIRAFELGNEADHYGGGSRPSGWSSADYTATFLGWTEFLQHNLSLPSEAFQAGSFADDPINGNDFTTANIIAEGVLNSDDVKLFNQHMYQYSTCDPRRNAIATLPNLVNHANITAFVNEFIPQVQAANNVSKDFVIGEFSSVSCSGKENVTDTYGQALWLADTMLYSASVNIRRMYLHQGATLVFQSSTQANEPGFSWYDLWYPVPTTRYGSARASPSFVAALLVTETVGSSNNTKISLIPIPDAPDVAAYAVWDGENLSRLTILNLGHRNVTSPPDTAAVAMNLSSIATSGATVKRMTGLGMDSKDTDAALWAGQSYTNGTATGNLDIEPLGDDDVLIVNGSEGVIVFL